MTGGNWEIAGCMPIPSDLVLSKSRYLTMTRGERKLFYGISSVMDDPQRWRLELKDSNSKIRTAAAGNLRYAGSNSVAACVDVEDVQNLAAAALEDSGISLVDSIDSHEPLKNLSDPLAGYWATTLLGRIGKIASRSQSILSMAVSDSPHLSLQERTAWALGKIDVNEPSVVKSKKKLLLQILSDWQVWRGQRWYSY